VLALDGTEVARFHFREELRPDAAVELGRFQSARMPVYLLSGDEPERVHAMGRALGLPEGHALGGLSPADKAALVRSRWGGQALMLGDGANDSLAFDAALCRGTPAVDTGLLEHKADFYLLGRGLAGLGVLFAAARSHRRTTNMVCAFALSYNALAVSAALAGWMSPLAAAIIMPLSSLASIGLVLTGFSRLQPPTNS
jgi:Cu2+-exporting ATPase